jgi:hypothetical protein
MPRKHAAPPKPVLSVRVTAELLLSDDEKKLVGWRFIATNKLGRKVLDRLMDGKITGLPYCIDTPVRAHAGGAGEYWVGFPKS